MRFGVHVCNFHLCNNAITTNNANHYFRMHESNRCNARQIINHRQQCGFCINDYRLPLTTSTTLFHSKIDKDNERSADDKATTILPFKFAEDIFSLLATKVTIFNNSISLVYLLIILSSYILISWKIAILISISFSLFWYIGRQVVDQQESYDLVDFFALTISFFSSYFLFGDNEENKLSVAFCVLLVVSSLGVMFAEFNSLFKEGKDEQDLDYWDNEMEKFMNKDDDVDK